MHADDPAGRGFHPTALLHVAVFHCHPAGEILQDLLSGPEREIMQEHHDFLPVGPHILFASYNQRRGKQIDLLRRDMRMHPVGPRPRREVESPRLAGRDHQVGVRHTILRIRRNLAMPVHDRLLGEIIRQVDVKPRARVQNEARASGAVEQPLDRGSASIDLDDPCRGPQRHGSLRGPRWSPSQGRGQERCRYPCRGGEEGSSGYDLHGRRLSKMAIWPLRETLRETKNTLPAASVRFRLRSRKIAQDRTIRPVIPVACLDKM